MTQDNLPRTTPADRHEIAHAATDHQPCRPRLMAQITVRVETRSGKQAIAILEDNHLATVEVPSQDQVIAEPPRRLPDSRVVGAQNAKVPPGQGPRLGADDGDLSATVCNAGAARMNPLTPAADDRVAHAAHADVAVVIAPHRK